MIKIANTQFWVHDQDEALAFYVGKLGWEVRSDVTMPEWAFRWLVVGPVGQPDVGLVLMPVPGQPLLDDAASAQLAGLVARGAGGTLFLETDDCRATYEELSARGVVFNDPPTPQAYGIDTSFRDPSGNNVRLTQVLEFSADRAGGTG
jgi:catechol 2,3-dioxygenase-like lactoylglutathione lyase family enzyme